MLGCGGVHNLILIIGDGLAVGCVVLSSITDEVEDTGDEERQCYAWHPRDGGGTTYLGRGGGSCRDARPRPYHRKDGLAADGAVLSSTTATTTEEVVEEIGDEDRGRGAWHL